MTGLRHIEHPGMYEAHSHLGGTRWEYRFQNGYGASVIRNPFSYGGSSGLFELAVLKAPDWEICYSTALTDDVLGCLTDEEVFIWLDNIEALEAAA